MQAILALNDAFLAVFNAFINFLRGFGDALHDIGDLIRHSGSAACERADLAGDNSKAFARRADTGGLDGGVHCQKVSFRCHGFDVCQQTGDLRHLLHERAHGVHCICDGRLRLLHGGGGDIRLS